MFYSEEILSRRGPLGKVWLAAHMERKLSKAQTLQTDIGKSVDAIKDSDVEYMALRLSGQLLLGVVRIYSRKAKYLLDDCNDALLRIKMAFRPGAVDMTEEQMVVNANTITLTGTGIDLDVLLPDMDWDLDFQIRPLENQSRYQANIDDITLPMIDGFQQFGDIGPSDGLGSQDFEGGDLDLELDFGNEQQGEGRDDAMSLTGSVGVGRDAAPSRMSVDSYILGGDKDEDFFSQRGQSRGLSEQPNGMDMQVDADPFGEIDLGDIGIGFGDQDQMDVDGNKTPGLSRASSPLTDAPRTPAPEMEIDGMPAPEPEPQAKRKPREKKQIIDSVTELGKNVLGGVNVDVSDILEEPHFLPRSTVVMRLLEFKYDPVSHFLPTKTTQDGVFFVAAPPGLAPELTELFMAPIGGSHKRRATTPGGKDAKKQRLDGSEVGDDEEVEQGRRAESLAPRGSDILGRSSLAPDLGTDVPFEDFQLEAPEFEPGQADVTLDGRGQSLAPSALSRLSTPAPFDDDEVRKRDDNYALASFDTGLSQSDADPVQPEGKGYSRNSVRALGIIRRELKPVDSEEDAAEEKFVSFNNIADMASRRAAASFFFELLVLSTRDCVKLKQETPYGNIEVRAKDKLWDQQIHASQMTQASSREPSALPTSRASSVARSIGSTLGL